MYVKFTTNVKEVVRRINVMKGKTRQGSADIAYKFGYTGKKVAKSFAPKRTGKLASMIVSRIRRTNTGYAAEIVSMNSTLGDGHHRNISNFNLARWLHTSPRAIAHIKSGRYNYMDLTQNYLKSYKDKIVLDTFKDI